MKSISSTKYFLRRLTAFAALLVALTVTNLPARAQSLVTFAQFIERNGAQDFVFNNNSASADFNTVADGSPIYFRYQNILNLDPSLQGFQEATLFLNAATTANGLLSGSAVVQPINASVNSIRILRDAPANVGTGARRNLLTVSFGPNTTQPGLTGNQGGNSATFSVTTPDHTLVFTSDFLNFNNTSQRNFALSFSSVLPEINLVQDGLLRSFAAAGSGTFASNPPPTVISVPTAAPARFAGRVVSSDGLPVSGASLTVSQSNGSTITARSNSHGYFNFPAIETGQIFILTGSAKKFKFAPTVLSLSADVNDFVLTAEPPL